MDYRLINERLNTVIVSWMQTSHVVKKCHFQFLKKTKEL